MDDKEQFLVEFEDVVNIGESGTSDFNELANRPSYNGQPMTGDTNIPEVPVVNDAKLTINQNGVEKGSFTANDSDDTTIDLDNTTYNDFIGTDGVEAGEAGLVPAPSTTDANKFLKADGTWDEPEETTEIEYIELTPTGVVAQGITVTASKYLDEVIDLAEAGIKVVFKVTLPSGTGFPTQGTYELPLFNWDATSNKAIAMTVVDLSGTLYSINFGYDPGSHVNTGGIAIAIVPTGGSGPTVVQTTGTSTTDVMSQDATSSMVFADPTTQQKIKIGTGTFTPVGDNAIEIGRDSKAKGLSTVAIGSSATADSFADYGIAIGTSTTAYGTDAMAIGYSASTNSQKAVALGRGSKANHSFSVALGAGATTSVAGEVNVGTGSIYTTSGYNSTNYRIIRGLHDGQQLHDGATLAQGNTLATSAPTTSTVGVLGQLYTDTTNMHTYQCTAISGDTYTWTQRW